MSSYWEVPTVELLSDSTQGITCTCGRVREEGAARGKDRGSQGPSNIMRRRTCWLLEVRGRPRGRDPQTS